MTNYLVGNMNWKRSAVFTLSVDCVITTSRTIAFQHFEFSVFLYFLSLNCNTRNARRPTYTSAMLETKISEYFFLINTPKQWTGHVNCREISYKHCKSMAFNDAQTMHTGLCWQSYLDMFTGACFPHTLGRMAAVKRELSVFWFVVD